MSVIDIDSRINRAVRELGAIEPEVRVARSRALRKTARWVRRQVLRYVAQKERMPQRRLNTRVYLSRVGRDDDTATLWFGVDPVGAESIGKPRQTKRGARVGRRFYRGAFVAAVFSPKEKVWIRLRSRYYDPALYPTRRRPGDRFDDPSLKHRFPVVRAAIPIDRHVDLILTRVGVDVEGEFERRFVQELRFAARYEGVR